MTDNRPGEAPTTNAEADSPSASDADTSTNPPSASDANASTNPPSASDASTNVSGGRSKAAAATDGSKAAATTDGPAAAASGEVSVPEAGPPEDAREEGNRQPPRYAPPQQEGFDWRGWVLVAIVVVSFLLVPGAILTLPYAQSFVESLGLTFRAAYLTLPMIPALLLGATAVWAAVRSRRP